MRLQARRWAASWLAASALLLPVAAMAQEDQEDRPADGRGNHTRQLPPLGVTSGAVVTGNGINYHNGPVMRAGVNIYYIWYGNWAQDSGANAILTDFAKSIGGSPYFAINTTYGDTVGNVQNSVKYAGSISNSGSLGTSLTDANIWTLVNNAMSSGSLPVDTNGVYFVLTAPYVAETSGFLTQYCGWHGYTTYKNTPIKYAFVGNPAANMGACAKQSTSPNGDAAADAMVSVIGHELEESATDPQLSAWYDSNGGENADKCAWTFGSMYTAANGSLANMKLGLRDFLIQQNWVNARGGYCALSLPADFSLSVSPASQTVFPGATTGNYTLTPTAFNGWAGTVTWSVTGGLPTGASATVISNAITISTTTGTAPGTYNFTIQGTDGTRTHTTTATLVVSAPTFSISISPSAQSVTRPSSGSVSTTYKVTVTPLGGFTGTVSLSASGATTGLSLSLSPASIASSGASTLTATVNSSARKATNKLTVTGASGGKSASASATLQVN